MTAISQQSLTRISGDFWRFPVKLTQPDGSPVDLSSLTVACLVTWPGDGQIALDSSDEDLANGSFVVSASVADAETVPLGRTAKLVIRLSDTDGPRTYAIVPLNVIAP